MRIRRSPPGRGSIALLITCLALVLGPVAATEGRSPAPDGTGSGFHPRPVVRTDSIDPRLRGRLPALIRAARSSHLRGTVLSGLVTRAGTAGPEVAVGFRLVDTAAAPSGLAASATTLAALTAAGAHIANRSGDRVEAYLPASALELLTSLGGIADAAPIIRPVPLGAVGIGGVGEGVALHGADAWQAAGITGAGVKVGIIDGGFIGLAARLGQELPPTVQVRCFKQIGVFSTASADCETETNHGTAVAETISDMAPGVSLFLANPLSQQDMVSSVAWMTSNGVKIINVSLGFSYEGPGDGTSPPNTMYTVIDQAVKGGALWVNAAGNSGQDGWIGPWQDADANGLLDFAPGDEGNAIGLMAGDILATLRWNDPWGHAADDYDLLLYGPGGTTAIASSEDEQSGSQDPVETLSFTAQSAGTYRLAIRRSDGNAVSRLQLLVLTEQDAPIQYQTADDTLSTPADSANPGMVSVGAVDFRTPDQVEAFSARGPTVDGRTKPDFVAADCATTATVNPFCGTSQSAPYASGAAALVMNANPKLTPSQLADFLRGHVVPLGAPIPNNISGSGRLVLGPPPQPPTPTSLSFVKAPPVGEAATPFRQQPVVQILDQNGEPITVGPGATTAVILQVGSNPGSATLTCDGGLSVVAVAGVATFGGCSLSAPGTAYTLTASVSGVPQATTAPFDVFLPGQGPPTPSLTVSSNLASVTYGSAVKLTATVGVQPGGPAVAGRQVTFQSSTNGSTWLPIAHLATGAGGAATTTYKPAANLRFRATLDGAADLYPATSSSVRVTVREVVTLRPTNGSKIKSIGRTRTTVFTATVRPLASGVAAGAVTFELSRLAGTRWIVVTTRVVPTDALGTARVGLQFGSPGTWSLRVRAASTAANANSDWSARERYKVI